MTSTSGSSQSPLMDSTRQAVRPTVGPSWFPQPKSSGHHLSRHERLHRPRRKTSSASSVRCSRQTPPQPQRTAPRLPASRRPAPARRHCNLPQRAAERAWAPLRGQQWPTGTALESANSCSRSLPHHMLHLNVTELRGFLAPTAEAAVQAGLCPAKRTRPAAVMAPKCHAQGQHSATVASLRDTRQLRPAVQSYR